MEMSRNEEALAAYKQALVYDQSVYPIWNQVMIMEYSAGNMDSLYKESKKCIELFSFAANPILVKWRCLK